MASQDRLAGGASSTQRAGGVGGGARRARDVAGRAFLPTRSLLEELGDMMTPPGPPVSAALPPPVPFGGEFLLEFLFPVKLGWVPLLRKAVAILLGAPGLQGGNFPPNLGALERLGGFFVLA